MADIILSVPDLHTGGSVARSAPIVPPTAPDLSLYRVNESPATRRPGSEGNNSELIVIEIQAHLRALGEALTEIKRRVLGSPTANLQDQSHCAAAALHWSRATVALSRLLPLVELGNDVQVREAGE